MTYLIQRFNDWRLERHISHLARQGSAACLAGNRGKARAKFTLMAEMISRRSQSKIASMEKKAGL